MLPMKIDWMAEACKSADEIMDIREEIHHDPEPGNREFHTAALIEERLHSYGIPTRRLLDTAVIGILRGEKSPGGPVVALRADMDALPVEEKTGWTWASENPGMMHACGHDIHMAAALGAARLLSKYTDCFEGEIRFIFQPDEEGQGGAERLVKAGVLKGAGAVFGAHVSPDLPLGSIGIRYGKFYAASDVFHILVHGKSCHGAEPKKGIDALYAASLMVSALKRLPDEFLPEHPVLTTGVFHAGTAENILAGEAEFKGIIRTLGPEMRRKMKDRLREIVREIGELTGADSEIRIRESYPGVVNTDAPTVHAETAALSLFGKDRVIRIEEPTMTTEDFGYYVQETGGSFYHIGVGGEYPLHNERFLPSSEAAVIGAAMHAETLYSWLLKNIH